MSSGAGNVVVSNTLSVSGTIYGATTNASQVVTANLASNGARTNLLVGRGAIQGSRIGSIATITFLEDTNTIIVTDAGGSNPNAWGPYPNTGTGGGVPGDPGGLINKGVNSCGWFNTGFSGELQLISPDGGSFYHTVAVRVPGDWKAMFGSAASGTVHVAYAQIAVTNWISTNGPVNASEVSAR